MDGLSGEANDVVDSESAGENAVASRIDAMIAACLSLAFTKQGTCSRFITHRFKYSKIRSLVATLERAHHVHVREGVIARRLAPLLELCLMRKA